MGSLCDACARPGSCCVGFVLATDALAGGTEAEVDALLADGVTCSDRAATQSFLFGRGRADFLRALLDSRLANVRLGLPFKRFYRAPNGKWHYWCPNLGRDGKCRDYQNRPAACHTLTPGEGRPCCHHVPRIGACCDRAVDQFRRPALA
jgi:Fe-S-cluster containining protein